MKTVILSAGGLRSLVATALVYAEPRKQVISLLHVKSEGRLAERRLAYARKQAVHFQCRLVEMELVHHTAMKPAAAAPAAHEAFESRIEFVSEQLADVGADRLIWPAQFDADFSRLAAITEQTLLLRHRLASRGLNVPRIETPLAELTDRQMMELGAVMDVPFAMAWSCAGVGDVPCGQCAGCTRRAAAFSAMLLDDPQIETGARRTTRSEG